MVVHPLVELVGRWEQQFAWAGTDPTLIASIARAGRQIGGGFNVYINGHAFKIQGDYFYLFGSVLTAGQNVARLQLDATF